MQFGGNLASNRLRKSLIAFADGLNASCLLFYALLLGPLGILKGPLLIERLLVYVLAMAPHGLLSRFVRAAIDWRVGNFDAAISEVEAIIICLESSQQTSTGRSRRRVLVDLYTLVTRAYLHVGRNDDGMLMVIRAKKSLGVERLPGLAELNSKTAHLIRAGLSAGRLLDGGGLATLFVKTPPAESPAPSKSSPVRQGATARPKTLLTDKKTDVGAKVIYFPLRPPGPDIS
jgi:hypothetical protein